MWGSIWNVIKGVGKGVLGLGGGGETNQKLDSILDMLGIGGKVASGALAGRNQQRAAEADYGLDRDRLNLDRFNSGERSAMDRADFNERSALDRGMFEERGAMDRALLGERGLMDRANLDLDRRNFQLKAPSARGQQAAYGDILANLQDVKLSGMDPKIQVPQMAGGLRPSLLSQNTRQLGGELSRSALMSQLKGDDFAPMPDVQIPGRTSLAPRGELPSVPGMPDLSPVGTPGKTDTLLNLLGWGGTLAGGLKEAGALKPRQRYDMPNLDIPEVAGDQSTHLGIPQPELPPWARNDARPMDFDPNDPWSYS